ncbi:hypothetical protein [Oleisolibacter albus]|uniref:hypothetical protein n=1 Tax=Oleisolibacter albus TaxID=2171757 RepID=UPI00138FBB83|nr:hypothetical protein [Oleisolibacter albus]
MSKSAAAANNERKIQSKKPQDKYFRQIIFRTRKAFLCDAKCRTPALPADPASDTHPTLTAALTFPPASQ